jgi:hypothetical protein
MRNLFGILPLLKASKLTYIATQAALEQAVDKGLLCYFELELRSDPIKRTLLLHPEVQTALALKWDIPCLGKLAADLESFVKGEHITVCLTPYEHRKAMMGLLHPPSDGTFDIRSRKRSPGTRVFGRFPCKDTFVALEWRPRSVPIDGIDKAPLGDRLTSHEWEFALLDTQKRWQEVLPSLHPLTGGSVGDYISENWSVVAARGR